jgi:hypothetical protein
VYAVIEKAYWRSTNVTEWFNTDTALIQDVLWHKACHPVTMNLKQIVAAMDAIIREKLEAIGACTSRLLAQKTELRVVES